MPFFQEVCVKNNLFAEKKYLTLDFIYIYTRAIYQMYSSSIILCVRRQGYFCRKDFPL